MKQAVFTLPNAEKGTKVVNERYIFTDGKHVRDEHDGKLLVPVLCANYGCTLEWIDDTLVVESSGEAPTPTLAKAQTSRAK